MLLRISLLQVVGKDPSKDVPPDKAIVERSDPAGKRSERLFDRLGDEWRSDLIGLSHGGGPVRFVCRDILVATKSYVKTN